MTDQTTVTLRPAQLLRQGYYLEKSTRPADLRQLIASIRPVKTRLELTRIGRDEDGGYLVPMDLEGITACFSPGVDTVASFESDLKKRFGIGSHLADFTVDRAPDGFEPLSFTKKFVGAHDGPRFTTLDSWMAGQPEYKQKGDFLLQMDIEGTEYAALLATRRVHLRRFRIMVIEFHDVAAWSSKPFFQVVRATFAKLLQDFVPVHIHVNNFQGVANSGGVPLPRVFEMTLLRRDRAKPLGPCDSFPHPLDKPNNPDRPEIVLPPIWYRQVQARKAAPAAAQAPR